MNFPGTTWSRAGLPISRMGAAGLGSGDEPGGWLPGGAAGGAGSASSSTESPGLAWREHSKYFLNKQTRSFPIHLPGERALQSPFLGTQTGRGGGRGEEVALPSQELTLNLPMNPVFFSM